MDEPIYITLPTGLKQANKGKVLHLKKALYGLKQAPRLWKEKGCSVMTKLGFNSYSSDECVIRRRDTWILIYVDDLMVKSYTIGMDAVKLELTKHLDMEALGALKHFLGVTFKRDENGCIQK